MAWTASGLRAHQACCPGNNCGAAGTADIQFGHRNSLILEWVANVLRYTTKLRIYTLGVLQQGDGVHLYSQGQGGWGEDGCPSSAGLLATNHNIVGKQIPFNAHVAMRGQHTPHPPQQLTGVVIQNLVQSWPGTGDGCSALSGHNALGQAVAGTS